MNDIPEKKYLLAPLIPGVQETYIYDKEKEYNEMYQQSRFAITTKKGGWDCIRHYEILANGCLPIFDISNCPDETLTTFPKKYVDEINILYSNWKENDEYINKYNILCNTMLEHTRNNCSTSATAKYFISKFPDVKNVLLIICNKGVNYSREFLWIGLKRYIQSLNGVAVEYPSIPYLYEDTSDKNLHGKGFTYSNRLKNDYNFSESELIEKIENNFWDVVIFGKIGPDELYEGTIPNFLLCNTIMSYYDKNKIVFLYGGDCCIDVTYENKYKNHIDFHRQFGTCFVRELKM